MYEQHGKGWESDENSCFFSLPQFMETIAAHYDEEARDAGVYIVSSCGYDCIPNDLGALLLQRTFNGELAYAESFMKVQNSVSEERSRGMCTPNFGHCVAIAHAPFTF